MAKVGPDKSQYIGPGEGNATQYGRFNTNQNAWGQPTATPTAPPLDNQIAVTEQPYAQQQQFIPMPEPGPVYRPTHAQPNAPQPHFQSPQPQSFDYQRPSTPIYHQDQPSCLPMPEPGPIYRPQPQLQPNRPPVPTNQPSTPISHRDEAPPSYQESQLAQNPSNRFRTDIFQSIDRLNTLKTQILERESRLDELQRRSELLDGVQFPGYELLNHFEREMNHLQSSFRAAQQHLKDLGEKENFIPGTRRKKLKIHIEQGSCCGTESHYYCDMCDKKPKIHIEGMCNSPDVFVQTCEQQNQHTGWIWGKQKLQIDGMWVSPKVHLKGLMFNPVIIVDGMWNKPEIHLEGICLNPEIRVQGTGVHPTIRITGVCHHLKLYVEGLSCGPRINIVGLCDKIETSMPGMCTGASVKVTGVCKNLKRSLGTFSPSVKFKGNDMKIRV